jgi:hypothetical protein
MLDIERSLASCGPEGLPELLWEALHHKPRKLSELAADIIEDWTLRQISDTLLVMRERGFIRWQDTAWRVGAERGRVGHVDVTCKGLGEWDAHQLVDLENTQSAVSRNTTMIRFASGWGF